MAYCGKTIDNPITKERITFLQTTAETDGQLLQFEIEMAPEGFISAEHVHPAIEESLSFISGQCTFVLNGVEQAVGPGESVVVPPNSPHTWWNAGDEPVRAVIEFRPAMNMEAALETSFGLARDGKTNKQGMPNIFQLAVIVWEYRNEVQPAILSSALRNPFFWLMARFGYLMGYRATYAKYSETAQL
jgi:quercetin dioxygenase-like cupin family protein